MTTLRRITEVLSAVQAHAHLVEAQRKAAREAAELKSGHHGQAAKQAPAAAAATGAGS